MVNYQLLISGRVQGVGMRWSIYQLASQHQLAGLVKNLPTGKVYCELQGEDNIVKKVIAAIKNGPTPYAKITNVKVTPGKISTYPQGFTIER